MADISQLRKQQNPAVAGLPMLQSAGLSVMTLADADPVVAAPLDVHALPMLHLQGIGVGDGVIVVANMLPAGRQKAEGDVAATGLGVVELVESLRRPSRRSDTPGWLSDAMTLREVLGRYQVRETNQNSEFAGKLLFDSSPAGESRTAVAAGRPLDNDSQIAVELLRPPELSVATVAAAAGILGDGKRDLTISPLAGTIPQSQVAKPSYCSCPTVKTELLALSAQPLEPTKGSTEFISDLLRSADETFATCNVGRGILLDNYVRCAL